MKSRESGNALFLILLGIMLLAALTYAATISGKSSGNLSQQTAATSGDLIMRYADNIHNAVQTVMTAGKSDGVDVSMLSFAVTALGANYTNANSSPATSVFNAGGGGMAYMAPDASWLDSAQSARDFYGKWYFPNNVCVPFVGTGGDGVTGGSAALCNAAATPNTAADVVIVLPYINSYICTYIDQKLGIALASGAAPPATASLTPTAGADEYGTSGFSASAGKAFYSTSGGTPFNGKYEGCIQNPGTTPASFFYYKVLFER